jgi:uncharacterized protein with PQ loop repeat
MRRGERPVTIHLLDCTSIVATAFAIPQFLPQILKLRATQDTAGVSWSWAILTSINNGAWIAYFALERYWTALVPATSATVLAGMLAVVLIRRGQATLRPSVLIGAWAALLVAAYPVVGRAGLGTLLTAAFFVQVAPSLWAAYRTARPTGISSGTWLLILGELSCWLVFGLYKSDPRLIALGVTGVIASTLILARIHRTSTREQPAAPRPAT